MEFGQATISSILSLINSLFTIMALNRMRSIEHDLEEIKIQLTAVPSDGKKMKQMEDKVSKIAEMMLLISRSQQPVPKSFIQAPAPPTSHLSRVIAPNPPLTRTPEDIKLQNDLNDIGL